MKSLTREQEILYRNTKEISANTLKKTHTHTQTIPHYSEIIRNKIQKKSDFQESGISNQKCYRTVKTICDIFNVEQLNQYFFC